MHPSMTPGQARVLVGGIVLGVVLWGAIVYHASCAASPCCWYPEVGTRCGASIVF